VDDKIEKNEMGRACTDGLRGEACTGFRWRNLSEGDPGIDRRIILRWFFRKWDVGVWTGLSWLRIAGWWRALVNAVTNLWIP
jgi:hypothetical protein